MSNLIIQISKYLIIILMALYTFQCFSVFRQKDEDDRNFIFLRQNTLMFFMHFIAFTVLYLEIGDITVLKFYGSQVLYFLITLILFRKFYPLASRLLVNNMCTLICIGFIMITRISYEQSVKQFKIIAVSTVIALVIPVIIRKLRFITKMYWFYTLAGIGLLALVALLARSTYGAKMSFNLGFISVQPSEFVKIIYVFAIAGLLTNARNFKKIVIATILAAIHVLILVISKDLGSALIFFVTYLVMLFVATRNPFLVLLGILGGAAAAVGAYFLFSHIRVRVMAWRDPFQDYYVGGYQICQSLFSIAAGHWFGTGLYQGSPTAITFVEEDFMFSAIAEELGSVFGICLILVCMSCFIMFVNIAMQLKNRFYRLVAVGLGAVYATQVFLTVGGGIKLIPLTGVTLPLVSYGGSSALSTLIMFAVVQGLYILQRDEERKKRSVLPETAGINKEMDASEAFYENWPQSEAAEEYDQDYQQYPDNAYDPWPYPQQTQDVPYGNPQQWNRYGQYEEYQGMEPGEDYRQYAGNYEGDPYYSNADAAYYETERNDYDVRVPNVYGAGSGTYNRRNIKRTSGGFTQEEFYGAQNTRGYKEASRNQRGFGAERKKKR